MTGTLENPAIGEKNEKGDPKIVELVKQFNALLDGSNKIPGTSLAAAAAIAGTQLAAAAEITNAQLKGEITNAKLAGEIEGSKIKAGTVEDSDLASPNNSFYRTLLFGAQGIGNGRVAGTYFLGNQATTNPPVSGGTVITTEQVTPFPVFYFAKADFEVGSKTQKLRLRAQASVNATKPTIKFTFGLYPITVAGGANVLTVTMGSVVASSTVEINEPAASTVTQAVNSDLTIPSDGAYVLGVVTSGTLTASSALYLSAQVQTRSV